MIDIFPPDDMTPNHIEVSIDALVYSNHAGNRAFTQHFYLDKEASYLLFHKLREALAKFEPERPKTDEEIIAEAFMKPIEGY